MSRLFWFISASLVVLGLGRVAIAAPRNASQEAEIEHAVEAVDPALVRVLRDANAAMDRGEAASAVSEYAALHERVPAISAITRRLCTAESRSGNPEGGTQHCREAVAADPSPENHAALAAALLVKAKLTSAEADEARDHAVTAVKLAPDAEYAQSTLCQVALAQGYMPALEECATKLQQIAPGAPETHLYRAVIAAARGDFDQASAELDTAHAAGLSDAIYAEARSRVEDARPKLNPLQRALLWTWSGLLGTTFVFFVVGMLLSDAVGEQSSRALRSVYRAFLTKAALFYYVFATIVGASLVLIVALVVDMFFDMTRPPRAVLIGGGVVALYVLFTVIRASFARVEAQDEGVRVDLSKDKKLRKLLGYVAKKLDEPPIDEVRVRSDASFEVVERGGIVGHLRKRNPRVLLVGAFALEGLSTRSFEALVTSELARLRDRGTGGGGVAVAQRNALDALLRRMEARGVATMANPAWWIVAAYRKLFERISEGAISLQETLADRKAAALFGGRALLAGIEHLVRRQIAFEARAAELVRDAIDAQGEAKDTRQAFDELWHDYTERVDAIEKLDDDGAIDQDDEEDTPAWNLFSDQEALERDMHAELRATVARELGISSSSAPST